VLYPVLRPWGRPPTQKSNTRIRETFQPSTELLTRLFMRHTRRGSTLESESKRIRPVYDLTSSLDPLDLSNQRIRRPESPAFSPQRFSGPPDDSPSSIDPLQQEERELSAGISRNMSLSVKLIDIPPSSADPLHGEGNVFPGDSFISRDATLASLCSVGSLL
jgi:hypothetical protein